eukprot:1046617-Amorphochlora_amoeboformis.AAC.2
MATLTCSLLLLGYTVSSDPHISNAVKAPRQGLVPFRSPFGRLHPTNPLLIRTASTTCSSGFRPGKGATDRSRRLTANVWESRNEPALEFWKGWFPSCRSGDVLFVEYALH